MDSAIIADRLKLAEDAIQSTNDCLLKIDQRLDALEQQWTQLPAIHSDTTIHEMIRAELALAEAERLEAESELVEAEAELAEAEAQLVEAEAEAMEASAEEEVAREEAGPEAVVEEVIPEEPSTNGQTHNPRPKATDLNALGLR